MLVSKLLKIKIALRHPNQRKSFVNFVFFPFAAVFCSVFNTQLIWMILIINSRLCICKKSFNKNWILMLCFFLQHNRQNWDEGMWNSRTPKKFHLNSKVNSLNFIALHQKKRFMRLPSNCTSPYINMIPLNIKPTEKNNLHPIWSRKTIKLFPINLHPLNIITKIIRRHKRIHINTSSADYFWLCWIVGGIDMVAFSVLLYLLSKGWGWVERGNARRTKHKKNIKRKSKKAVAVASVKRGMTMGKMCMKMLCTDIDVNVHSESYNTLLIHCFLFILFFLCLQGR